jgi:DNA-nicking Smr family endonuclease
MGQERDRPTGAQQADAALVHQPFRGLQRLISRVPVGRRVGVPRAEVAPVATEAVGAEELFRNAVTGVTPLGARARERVARPAPAALSRAVTPADNEALAELCELVSGGLPFDISNSDEYIEGAVVGLDPRLLRRLRAGEFACQGHLDLHGLTSAEARTAVQAFLDHASHSGKRCVLIIHGRGRNSKDQIPVLKGRLTSWLARGPGARQVLAFTSARPCDGGAGALYVLLRRERQRKQPIRVTNGAKW